MRTAIRLLASVAALTALSVSAAWAEPPTALLTDLELDSHRGGYLVAGGMPLGFGAVTRTFIDGSLAMETQVTWGAAGADVQRTAGQGMTALGAPLDTAILGAIGTGLSAADLSRSVVMSQDGQSAVIQHLGSGVFANMVLNSANDRTISQSTDVTLTLPGFQAAQAQIGATLAAQNLAQEMTAAAMIGRR